MSILTNMWLFHNFYRIFVTRKNRLVFICDLEQRKRAAIAEFPQNSMAPHHTADTWPEMQSNSPVSKREGGYTTVLPKRYPDTAA